jgi:deoxyribose-phosphate aldolase
MIDTKLIDELVEEVMVRLTPEAIWAWGENCRTVCVEKDAGRVRYIVECGAERIGFQFDGKKPADDLSKYIDHTLLKPNATKDQIETICQEAATYGFASVCVNPCWVKVAERLLRHASAKVCTVVGFPLGANVSETKVYETRRAIFDGATEIDMVLNVGALKSGCENKVQDDIQSVVEACHENNAICKVILETAFLSDEEKAAACRLAKEAAADFVKTSTGFGPGGATVDDVALMRRVVGPDIGVKAAGGIKDLEGTQAMLKAGANRIGASAGVRIVKGEAAGKLDY